MKKRAIPQVPKPDQSRQSFDSAIKEVVEVIIGRRGEPIAPLDQGASTAEVIAKVNQLIELLQA